jgi:hypothetical protein
MCNVAGMKVSLERVVIVIVIVTVTATAIVTVTEDSMVGMEGLRKMGLLQEETISEEACQAEMIEEGLGV